MKTKNNRDLTCDLITRFYEGLKNGDFSQVQFAADVTLQTPFIDPPICGREIVIDALEDIAESVEDIQILRLVIEGEFACAIILFRNKKGVVLNMCDTHRIVDGRLVEIRPFFYPRPLA